MAHGAMSGLVVWVVCVLLAMAIAGCAGYEIERTDGAADTVFTVLWGSAASHKRYVDCESGVVLWGLGAGSLQVLPIEQTRLVYSDWCGR